MTLLIRLNQRLGAHQEPAELGRQCVALLVGSPDRGRRRPAVHRPAPVHPRVRGRWPGRSSGDGASRRRGPDRPPDRHARGLFPLSQATIYLAKAPKSNAVKNAYGAAAADAAATAREAVPLHLRNAVTPLMKSVGYGQGYRYVHDDPQAREEMPCLPEALRDRVYFEPGNSDRTPRKSD